MDPIEQVILYVKDYRKPETGEILSKTPGVSAIDEEELIGWAFDFEGDSLEPSVAGPYLQDMGLGAEFPEYMGDLTGQWALKEMCLYFHPLPSGCYALCRLSSFQDETDHVASRFVHALVLTPRLLRAYHNNVLTIYQSLAARSSFQWLVPTCPEEVIAQNLTAIKVGIRHTPVINADLLETFRDYPGATSFANLLSSSINSVCTIFTRISPSIPLINGVIQCLPVSLRLEMSFSTSLHFSGMRPIRLMAVHENSQVARDVCQKYAVPFFHFFHIDENVVREKILSNPSWSNFVFHVIDQGKFDFFDSCLQGRLKSFSFETGYGAANWYALNRVGKTLLDEFVEDDRWSRDDFAGDFVLPDDLISLDGFWQLSPGTTEESPLPPTAPKDENSAAGSLRGDLAHRSFSSGMPDDISDNARDAILSEGDFPLDGSVFEEIREQIKPISNDSSPNCRQPVSQRRLVQQFPEYESVIKKIDSLVARSLFGDQTALEMLEKNWQELKTSLTFDELGILREAYIHLVQSIIVQPRDPEYPKHPSRTIDSLEVLNIFLKE